MIWSLPYQYMAINQKILTTLAQKQHGNEFSFSRVRETHTHTHNQLTKGVDKDNKSHEQLQLPLGRPSSLQKQLATLDHLELEQLADRPALQTQILVEKDSQDDRTKGRHLQSKLSYPRPRCPISCAWWPAT